MRTITIVLRGEDFSAQMANMRTWLDQHMFRPSKFTYKQDREIITISIDFLSNHHAEAFKRHFDGHEPEAHFSLPNGLDPLGRTSGEGRTTEYPAQWPRLVGGVYWRTRSERRPTIFGSASAKESMELAAQGWEQLAEQLEHRLAGNGSHQPGFSG